MSQLAPPPPPSVGAIDYPDDDGLPMADNTKQLRWIVVLYDNLCALFGMVGDVFVAANHLWYPVEGEPETRTAPDVMVVFGRPKGDRGSYKQWEEDGLPVTVAFEILSPGNTVREMADKLAFYDEHGVEEYYMYDPDANHLQIFVRKGEVFVRVRKPNGFVSPRLGIRFDLSGSEMIVYESDGSPFLTYEDLKTERAHAERRAKDAEQRTEKAEQHAADVQRRADRQAELMRRALGQHATADELQELQHLLEQPAPST